MRTSRIKAISKVLVSMIIFSNFFTTIPGISSLEFTKGYSDQQSVYADVYGSPSTTVVPTNTSTPTPADPLLQGLKVQYDFNGDANDKSGNGKNATVVGSSWVDSNNGKALKCADNRSDRVSIPYTVADGVGDFTVSSIIKIDSVNTDQIPNGPCNTLLSGAKSNNDNALLIYYNGETGKNFWHVSINGTKSNFQASSNPINDGLYHSYTFIRDGALLRLYIDGVKIGNDITSTNSVIDIDPNGLVLGQEQDSVGGSFEIAQGLEGCIDEFRFYSRALSSTDIENLNKLYIIPTPTSTPTSTSTPTATSTPIATSTPTPTSLPYLSETKSYYQAVSVPNGINWNNAKIAAEQMTYNGMKGHLATICSKEENDFIVSTFGGPSAINTYWLGGYQPVGSAEPNGNWTWVTGEEWTYSCWISGEPNNYGGEDALHYWAGTGMWNDYPFTANCYGYIVEFDNIDSEKPSIPQNVKITAKSGTTLSLSWDASTDSGVGVYAYNIYRNGTKVKTIATTSFADKGLEPSTAYSYTVSAIDRAGNESDMSTGVSETTTEDTEAPSIPQQLLVAYKTGTSANLSWSPSTDNYKVSGYEVLRDGVVIGTSTTTSYKDANLTTGKTYKYVVKAFDLSNKSNASAELSVVPLTPHILRVEPITGVTVGGNRIQTFRVWISNSNNLTGMTASLKHSIDNTNWVEDKPFYGPYLWDSTTAYINFEVNLGSFVSGTYYMNYMVTDADNNKDSLAVSYTIDRSVPGVPTNLKATGDIGKIILSWNMPSDTDISGYNVYRSTTETGSYTYIARVNGAATNFYNDLSVYANTTYYYKVIAIDKFDQESELSAVASTAPLADTVKPVILGIEPTNGTLLGSNAYITVRGSDNIGLKSIKLQYSLNGTVWTDIQTKQTSGTATFNWSTSPLNGNVYIRALAYDNAGIVSDGTPVKNYTIDTTGPEKVSNLSYVAHTTYVVLKWNDVSDQDLSYFAVEKKKVDGSFERIGTSNTTLGMNVTNLAPNTSYTYRVVAYDKFGNRGVASDEIVVKTLNDTTEPWINGIGPAPSRFGSSIPLWISAGDNSNIVSIKVQVSKDQSTWEDLTTINNTGYGQNYTGYYNYDVSSLPEGKVRIRAIAFDGSLYSNSQNNYVEYLVDHTGPVAPGGFIPEADTGFITLKWNKSVDVDSRYYKVYRSLSSDGQFTLIAARVDYLGYVDRNVELNKEYFYKVSSVDEAGNEGNTTSVASTKVLLDDEAPKILSISPNSGSTLPANPNIAILASDNYKLGHITVDYRALGYSTWTNILEKDLSQYSEVTTMPFNTSGLTEGAYEIRAKVQDSFGKESEIKTVTYTLNLVSPTKPVVNGKAGGWKTELSWALNAEPDFAGYRVYRSTTSGSNYQIVKETKESSFIDSGLTPGVSYYYVVEALDVYRNGNKSDEIVLVPTDEDTTAPVSEAGDSQITTTNVVVWFDGTLSKDNNRISEYLWDFGDGTASSQAQPMHVYSKVGTYTVRLTVKDPAGNSNTDTATVTVKEPLQVGTLEVRVVDDETGSPIGGASVVVEYADGTMYNTTTNGAGIVNAAVAGGSYKVYAYKTDYKPSFTSATAVINTTSQTTLKLAKGQLVVGELTVNRMTLDQIKDAGIDVSAPENQWVYKFEVHLAFQNRPLPVQEFIVNGNGSVINYQPLYISGGGNGGGGGYIAYPAAIPVPNHPEISPTIAYLVIPGEARFLKEFFEVTLALENTADPVFVIEQSKAVLNLPEGLKLAKTREPQSQTVSIGDFKGGEKKEVKWIIRGEQKGLYTLQADFTGILWPFEEPVKAVFKNDTPFRVWGDDALKMHVYAQNKVDKGYPYDIRFELENVSTIPVYYSTLELLESGKQNYFYAPNQELLKKVETLKAGEKLVKTYTLVPSITGDLLLDASYVLKTGGNAEIPSVLHPMSVPENMLNVAPKLTETQNGNVVILSWGEVAGATGYKIYSVRKDRYMAKDPGELIATLPAGTLTYNITETTGTKDYIVTTLSESGEKMRHAIAWPNLGNTAPAIGYLDSPKVNQSVTGIVNVRGWFLDQDGVSKVEVLVDGNVVGQATYGAPRTDVLAVYPDYNNANSGFNYGLNTSKLSQGKHTLTIRETSNKNVQKLLNPVSIDVVLKPLGWIDYPKASQLCNGNVDVKGWFLDYSEVSKVEVFVDGVSKGTAVYGDARADVKAVYPYYNNDNSGFRYVLDTSKLPTGTHSVTVCGTGKNGTITTIGTVSITVLPTIGSIDSPKANATVREKVNLYGWILDPNGVSKIEVLVDNALVGTATYGSPRSDVKSVYPLYNNANSGFYYALDTSKLSEGKHTITVREISNKASSQMLIKNVDIMVSKLPVKGWLDNPVGTTALKGKTSIWGWFLDISGVSKVNVLVDNVLVGQAIYGGTRNDVFVAYPQYNNKNSGFYYLLDTLKLSNGKHTLKIVEIGVHGEQTVIQKVIIVNN